MQGDQDQANGHDASAKENGISSKSALKRALDRYLMKAFPNAAMSMPDRKFVGNAKATKATSAMDVTQALLQKLLQTSCTDRQKQQSHLQNCSQPLGCFS